MPLQQGDLDGLCGIYATVNALKAILANSGVELDCELLFNEICVHLEKRGWLADVVRNGLNSRKLAQNVIDIARAYVRKRYQINVKRKSLPRRRMPLNLFWNTISKHVQHSGASSVILGLEGKHDHWTCIRKITANALHLSDSDGLKRLNRSQCTTARPTVNRRPHRLCIAQTWCLLIE
jgi:hypothetical protein